MPSPAQIPTEYTALVQTRKTCRLCPDLVNPADAKHAHLDGDEIGPWSRWLAGKPAKILIVGQDWGTISYYQKHNGRDIPGNLTNKRLVTLLRELGFDVPEVGERTERSTPVFLTNAILCLKPGDTMSAVVKSRWFAKCGPMLRATVAAVGAENIICLGRHAYGAVAKAFGCQHLEFRTAVGSAKPLLLPGGARAFAVFHPAARAVNRSWEQQKEDWRRIRAIL
jgi:uracil-DNA glycosylase